MRLGKGKMMTDVLQAVEGSPRRRSRKSAAAMEAMASEIAAAWRLVCSGFLGVLEEEDVGFK